MFITYKSMQLTREVKYDDVCECFASFEDAK